MPASPEPAQSFRDALWEPTPTRIIVDRVVGYLLFVLDSVLSVVALLPLCLGIIMILATVVGKSPHPRLFVWFSVYVLCLVMGRAVAVGGIVLHHSTRGRWSLTLVSLLAIIITGGGCGATLWLAQTTGI